MSRACIFCQRRDETLNREHVYPDWLANYFDRASYGENVVVHEAERRQWRAKIFQHKARLVCSTCNSGWMSTLESEVGPILGPMMQQGKQTILTPEIQGLLSTWAFKTVLMLQKAIPNGTPIIPDTHYTALYQTQKAPDSVVVLIAYRSDFVPSQGNLLATFNIEQITENMSVHRALLQDIQDDQADGHLVYGVTMAVGHVVFQVVGHNLHQKHLEMLLPDNTMATIHPSTKQFSWPGSSIEGVGGLEVVIKALNGGN